MRSRLRARTLAALLPTDRAGLPSAVTLDRLDFGEEEMEFLGECEYLPLGSGYVV